MSSILLLNSGGPDSACLAKWMNDQSLLFDSLYINFGSINHKRAFAAAAETAQKWANDHHTINVDFGFVPNADSGEIHRPQIPYVTVTIISLGLAFASKQGYKQLYIASKNDIVRVPRYEDLANWFFNAVHLKYPLVEIKMPFLEQDRLFSTYPQIMEFANVLPHELSYTVSCEKEFPCGECFKCIDREKNGID